MIYENGVLMGGGGGGRGEVDALTPCSLIEGLI